MARVLKAIALALILAALLAFIGAIVAGECAVCHLLLGRSDRFLLPVLESAEGGILVLPVLRHRVGLAAGGGSHQHAAG